jgi:hypothetical protein
MKKGNLIIAAFMVAAAFVCTGITQMPAANACPRHDQMNLNGQVRDIRHLILAVEEEISGHDGLIDQANLAKEIPNTMPKQWEAVEPDSATVRSSLEEIDFQLQSMQEISAGRKYSAKTSSSVKHAFKSLDARTLKARSLVKKMNESCKPGACRDVLNASAFSLHKEVRQMEKLSLDILEGTLGKSLGL